MPYYVYILLCKDESYYTGYTTNIERRVEQHKRGKGAKYTKLHKPKELVHVEKFESLTDAIKRERQIKPLSHDKKRQLIAMGHTNSTTQT